MTIKELVKGGADQFGFWKTQFGCVQILRDGNAHCKTYNVLSGSSNRLV